MTRSQVRILSRPQNFPPYKRWCFVKWADSSVGRAPRLQRGGLEFESPSVHQSLFTEEFASLGASPLAFAASFFTAAIFCISFCEMRRQENCLIKSILFGKVIVVKLILLLY